MKTPLSQLKPSPWNPRTISTKRLDSLCKSIKADPEFLELRPVLAMKDGTIYGGNQRYLAAKKLGMTDVPAVLSDISEALAKERALKDNNAFGDWQIDLLLPVVEELKNLGKDIEALGFPEGYLDKVSPMQDMIEDEAPPLPKETTVKLGDLYQLGNHRLLCGDATKIEDVERLMNGQKADMVFTDPPYGIKVVRSHSIGGGGAFGGKKNAKPNGANFIKANAYSEIIGDDTTEAAEEAYHCAIAIGCKNMIVWGGNYFADFLPPSRGWVCWDKIDGVEGTTKNFSDMELAWTTYDVPARIIRHRWQGLLKASEHKDRRVHPTQKPIALATECFDIYKAGENILDLFGGSGSTLIACEQLKRKCYMMELSPLYIDVIIQRWETFTGESATLLSHG